MGMGMFRALAIVSARFLLAHGGGGGYDNMTVTVCALAKLGPQTHWCARGRSWKVGGSRGARRMLFTA
jgi:hypothetical protein